MEDKRIKKTKKNLKSTLIAMLNQMSASRTPAGSPFTNIIMISMHWPMKFFRTI